MSFEEFALKIVDGLKLYCGPDTEVVRQDIVKINDLVQHGIVMRASGKTTAAPVLYLDRYYADMENGSTDLDDILSEIRNELAAGNRPDCISNAADILDDWEKIKENIYPVLLSAERNRKYVEDLISEEYLDLKIVYAIRFGTDKNEDAVGTAKMMRTMFAGYGINIEELHNTAVENLRKECTGMVRMEDILFNQIRKNEEIKPIKTMDDNGMYCMCNRSGLYGAACMLLTDVIQNAANGRNCFIIPSSIHEVLIVPDRGSVSQESLDEMVNSVNMAEVSENEILSDHAYYFDAGKGIVRMSK